MSAYRRGPLLLALHPTPRGIAFVLFEGPLSPVDWGTKAFKKPSEARLLEAVVSLIDYHQPEILVLEDCKGHVRRPERVRRLLRLAASHAEGQAIEVHSFDRDAVRECFRSVGAVTRYEIAQAIASRIAMFGHRMPPVPKPWKKDHSRMGLFVAASLAMTFYCNNRRETIDDLPTDL